MTSLTKLRHPFPYSDTDPNPKECKNSGEGYIHCTASIRVKYAKVCSGCRQNPDTERGLDTFNGGT